jgi:transcription initiation factor TFIIH subunit 1
MKVVLTPIDNPTNTDPKSNEAHVLEFDDLVQRDNCRTYITKTISSFRQQSKDLKISPEEKQQLEVLASNPELRQLYEALVKKDVITNEEFWSQHKDMLPTMEKQQTGLKNSFILKNFYKDDTVHITATAMKQIFVQYPGVKAKYEQFVPHSVSETEFWTRFAKAFYLNQTRKSHEGRPDDIFGKAEDISDVPMPTNVQVEKFVDLTTDTSREVRSTFS